jgi:hypothetical protein
MWAFSSIKPEALGFTYHLKHWPKFFCVFAGSFPGRTFKHMRRDLTNLFGCPSLHDPSKLGQYFSNPSLVHIYLFPTPSIKLKLGVQIGWRLLLIATHLDNRS